MVRIAQTAFPAWIYAGIDPKGGAFKSCPSPEIPCVICSKPVDLSVDLSADESGKAVHTECYVKRISTTHSGPSIVATAD
jgi:hypothetical protein